MFNPKSNIEVFDSLYKPPVVVYKGSISICYASPSWPRDESSSATL